MIVMVCERYCTLELHCMAAYCLIVKLSQCKTQTCPSSERRQRIPSVLLLELFFVRRTTGQKVAQARPTSCLNSFLRKEESLFIFHRRLRRKIAGFT